LILLRAVNQKAEQERSLLVAQACLGNQAAELNFLACLSCAFPTGLLVACAQASLFAREAAPDGFCVGRRLSGSRCRRSRNRLARSSKASSELGVVDLDFSETGLEREPTDAFGLARFGDFELLLQSGYVFLDLR
jgi:hypothetical protein